MRVLAVKLKKTKQNTTLANLCNMNEAHSQQDNLYK